jgi:hypothetical protein
MGEAKSRCSEVDRLLGLSPLARKELAYLCALKRHLEITRSELTCAEPDRNWMRISLGKSGFELTALVQPSRGTIEAELQIKSRNAAQVFAALEKTKDAIHQEFGRPLEWRKPVRDNERHLVVTTYDADIDDKSDRDRQFDWFKENLERLYQVFKPRVDSLASIGR